MTHFTITQFLSIVNQNILISIRVGVFSITTPVRVGINQLSEILPGRRADTARCSSTWPKWLFLYLIYSVAYAKNHRYCFQYYQTANRKYSITCSYSNVYNLIAALYCSGFFFVLFCLWDTWHQGVYRGIYHILCFVMFGFVAILSTALNHDDVIKWKHFPRYWPFVRGIHRSPVKSPHKGQWRGALMFSLICAWINGWVNNVEAGDLRRHRAHYDVIVMWIDVNSHLCCPGSHHYVK